MNLLHPPSVAELLSIKIILALRHSISSKVWHLHSLDPKTCRCHHLAVAQRQKAFSLVGSEGRHLHLSLRLDPGSSRPVIERRVSMFDRIRFEVTPQNDNWTLENVYSETASSLAGLPHWSAFSRERTTFCLGQCSKAVPRRRAPLRARGMSLIKQFCRGSVEGIHGGGVFCFRDPLHRFTSSTIGNEGKGYSESNTIMSGAPLGRWQSLEGRIFEAGCRSVRQGSELSTFCEDFPPA